MQHEVFLIPLDRALADEFASALGEPRPAWHEVEAPATLIAQLDPQSVPHVVVCAADAAQLDVAWWRELRRRVAAAQLLLVCRACDEAAWRRWLLLGAVNVLQPPFRAVDLEAEFAGEPTLSNLFHRNPALASQGKVMFRYSFPSDPQFIPGVVHVIALLALEFGFAPADYTMNLPLALDEAVSNAIIHGNRRDRQKRVEVEGQIDAQSVRIKVRDEGQGFERDRTRDPVHPENLLASSGRGLFLIESVMDEVRHSQEGRCIEMVKKARAAAPAAKPAR
jgi:serine/threonine-protein kinase RsbW